MTFLLKNAPSNVLEDYTLQVKLGEGGFAEVMKAVNNKTGDLVAIKFIRKKKILVDPLQQSLLMNEIAVQKQLKHPNIIQLREIYETPEHVCLVMDLVTGGELFDRIIKQGSYTERDASIVMLALFRTIKYIHDKDIAHRDLKPENCLYENSSPTAALKISDFGFATVCQAGELMEACCGTLSYVAPEVLKEKGYGLKADIWSLGCIMYVLLAGAYPFYDEDDAKLFELVKAGNFSFPSPGWDPISAEAKDLISKILVTDPEKRFTVDQCLDHGWFKAALPSFHLTEAQKGLKECRGKRKWKVAMFATVISKAFGKKK